MNIAYIISAYKYPRQLIRLVNSLNTPSASFFIHIDKKTDDPTYHKMVNGLSGYPNIYFLKRHMCYWGDFGHVQATIEGINEIIRRKILFDYVVLLTGQDYPIKTNEQIKTFFEKSGSKSYMEYFPLPCENWEGGGIDRIEQWHMRFFNHQYAFPKNRHSWIRRKFPKGLRPYGGSSYWCLSNACITYIHRFIKTHPGFMLFFRYVDVPDELIFQTILINSSLADTIVNDDLRYIDWKDWNAANPGILDRSDFERLEKSTKLFARKFDMTVDPMVLDLIDQEIR